MKAAVIVFPGSNSDRDAAVAVSESTGKPTQLIWHGETKLPKLDLIVLPGGFAYGDYLRCGAMSARSPVMAEVIRRANQGVPVIGICNGFQILTETGLLPGVLMRNRDLRFICRNVHVRTEQTRSPFTSKFKKGEVVSFNISHNEGNYYTDKKTLAQLEDKNLVAFRYCDAEGRVNDKTNPNGALNNIAGILSAKKNVLGLMPHPERGSDPKVGFNDGRKVFDSLLESVA